MSSFLVVLFSCLVAAQAKCFPIPRSNLPEGCRVGNLTVMVDPSYEMITGTRCNTTVGEYFINTPPRNVSFQRMMESVAPAYLLTAVDITSKNLVWMISNLTLGPQFRILPSNGSKGQEVMFYKKPQLSQYSPQHIVEYFVFEEHRANSSSTYTYSPSLHASPFNLSAWINSQQTSGITICGPVAGGSVVVSNFAPTTAPSSGPRTTSHSGNSNAGGFHHHRKNSSNRNAFDGVLLAGLIVIGAIFKY